jgi:hypothetical protein
MRSAKGLIGTIRRECLDWMIPLSEAHLRGNLKIWVRTLQPWKAAQQFGSGSAGPAARGVVNARPSNFRQRLGEGADVRARPVLGGLHHEYYLVPAAV